MGNIPPTHLAEKGCFFFVCITWEIAVNSSIGEVMADFMGVAVDNGVSILIVSLSVTVFIGGSFGFRRCGIFNIFLMLKFCAVDFCHQFV